MAKQIAKKTSSKKGKTTTSKVVTSNARSIAKKSKTRKISTRAVAAEIVDGDEAVGDDSNLILRPDDSLTSTESLIASDIGNIDDELLLDQPKKKSLLPTTSRSSSTSVSTTDPLSIYLAEIRKYPLLTKEQELELAKRYFESKDPAAAQDLVRANLRFVVKVAAEYSKFGAKMIDLIQEGNVGLMHAVKDFNPYKGARLITYAVWWIRGYIQEFLMRQYSMVRIGTTQNQRKLYYQLQKEKDALDNLGKAADLKLIATKLGIPEEEVRIMAQRMSGRDVSLDRPLDDDSGATLGSLQGNIDDTPMDEALSRNEQIEILKEKIEEIRPSLNEKEKIILEERLLNDAPLTLQEIGEKYGITREAVRQAEARLMKKIKDKMEPES